MTTLFVIPARGGSKGIKKKNLQLVNGITLTRLAFNFGLQCLNPGDFICISSDDPVILSEGDRDVYEFVPVERPVRLSGDIIEDFEVLRHSTLFVEGTKFVEFENIVMLQPTSPMRIYSDYLDCLGELERDPEADLIFTVSESDSKLHPLKQFTITKNSLAKLYDNSGLGIIARQQLTPVYHRNGLIYVIRKSALMTYATFHDVTKKKALITERRVVNIDTIDDLRYLEFMKWQGENER